MSDKSVMLLNDFVAEFLDASDRLIRTRLDANKSADESTQVGLVRDGMLEYVQEVTQRFANDPDPAAAHPMLRDAFGFNVYQDPKNGTDDHAGIVVHLQLTGIQVSDKPLDQIFTIVYQTIPEFTS